MKPFSSEESGTTAPAGRWARRCFALVAGVELLVLASWIAGRWELLSLGDDWVPTAPLTAAALLALAAAGWLWQAHPAHAAVRWLGTALALAVILAILLLSAGIFVSYDLPGPGSAGPAVTPGGIPVGRMSPLTAVGLLLASAGLLLRIHAGSRKELRQAAAILVFTLLFTSAGIISSYLLQMPVFYESPMIPMALLTAIGLGILSLGLLLLMGSDVWPVSLIAASGGG
ncbi:MAG: hypothetical protein LC732_03285, partial [Acidobacteria bacterium]|nr:hypothetical protein [Acidobacteriota bacterium]